MFTIPKATHTLVLVLVVLGGMFPLAFHRWTVDATPAVSPQEAALALAENDVTIALIDCRTVEEFRMRRVQGSMQWPLSSILALSDPRNIPASFRGKTMHLICATGVRSAVAVRKLRSLGYAEAFNVRGGIAAWPATPTARSTSKSGLGIHWVLKAMALVFALSLALAFRPPLVGIVLVAGQGICIANLWVWNGSSATAEGFHLVALFMASSLAILTRLDGCIAQGRPGPAKTILLIGALLAGALLFLPWNDPPGSPSSGPDHPADRGVLSQILTVGHVPVYALLLLGAAAFLHHRTRSFTPVPLVLLACGSGQVLAAAIQTGLYRLTLVIGLGGAFGDAATDLVIAAVLLALLGIKADKARVHRPISPHSPPSRGKGH